MNILNQSGIYKITCLPTGKVYVGSSFYLIRRRNRHWAELKAGKHHSSYLQRAWKKYGPDAFAFEVVELVADRSKLIEREQAWITVLNALGSGFNMVPADKGRQTYKLNLTPEARARRSELMKHRLIDPNQRIKMEEGRRRRYAEDPEFKKEVYRKITETKIGLVYEPRSADSRQRSSEAVKKAFTERPDIAERISRSKMGKGRSAEVKEACRQRMLGRKQSKELIEKRVAKTAKTYRLYPPEGEPFVVTNLHRHFAHEPKMAHGLVEVARGYRKTYKKWRCEKVI